MGMQSGQPVWQQPWVSRLQAGVQMGSPEDKEQAGGGPGIDRVSRVGRTEREELTPDLVPCWKEATILERENSNWRCEGLTI